MFGRKKQADEEKACALCVFARRDEEGRVFCRKRAHGRKRKRIVVLPLSWIC